MILLHGMHKSAAEHLELFLDTYITNEKSGLKLVEIGSQDFNGSIRKHLPDNIEYIGVDIEEGENVDIKLSDPYSYPIKSNSIDYIVTTSCFEHTEFFWLTLLECLRILKPQGLLYINAPSNGYFHQYPYDYYRFYPDSGVAFQNWGRHNGYNCLLLESFIGHSGDSIWNDFVAVILKDSSEVRNHKNRIVKSNIEYFNGRVDSSNTILNKTLYSEDILKLEKVNFNYLAKKKFINFQIRLKKINYKFKQEIKKLIFNKS